ncbi:acyl-CoA dehydrogenase family protein [Streptomyces albipurpureus]|uniref:Acyl-CoA/acyl-ACP dehydrogenase n=1 Tax=Streptomyces albipurpureus TaxID=2897419 RepID=A0ABT0UGL3_9ACTN|nr:acyl-CoA dehydrogenase family protein [Streptomyces sp. CWNU-1]MCM2387569.1 acyl-CoA/acyl-ACP dehydrogenase [Streptomyces sp. CWNU-1]
MLLDLDQDRRDFRDFVRSWVHKNCPPDVARDLEKREHQYPHELWAAMAEAGFHAVGIDEKYGGQGGDAVDTAVLARELARSLAGLTWVWGVPSFAGAKAIGHAGSEEQKQEYLPRLARGEIKFSIAVTEPSGGTDLVGAMRTRATKADGGWRITGQKMWSTGAKEADYLLLLARSGDPEAPGKRPLTTLFLVPVDSPGIETRYIPKIAMRAMGSCEVFLDDVFVPDAQVLGEPHRGFRALTGSLNNERVMAGAVALGCIDGVLDEALFHVKTREAFGKTIGSFQIIQQYIAEIALSQKQAELMVFDAAWREVSGEDYLREANMVKIVTSEYAVAAADKGIQILGGLGLAQETHAQRFWRDTRQFRIAPISNEMARNTLAESYGLPRSF